MAIEIPERSVFKASEVCSIAEVQPYVLKSWEAEFPSLGKSKGDARVYRRADVETVLEIKRLLYEEGLTLGAARRKLDVSVEVDDSVDAVNESLGVEARERIALAKKGLRAILELLSANDSQKKGLFDDEPVSGIGRATKVSTRRQAREKVKRTPRVARAPKKK
tara:strand:+ start:73 stop:564 length:492 start_codon:yes stop_codon:yes gene_type:complete